ncbi:MAG: ABC transporter ATP-binding protein [Rhizobiaceae bacterium]
MTLAAENLVWRADRRPIVDGISLTVSKGEFLGIVGPNGSGKTSLIALLTGLRQPASGSVSLDGVPLSGMRRKAIARRIALVEQQAETAERITARQAVELGRTPHLGPLAPWSSNDDAIVDDAMNDVGMADFADRHWNTLSGGERQRLHIARALAQKPEILFLDEPTNHLDIHNQLALLDLVKGRQLTVVAALHDLNHAAMFCDRIAVMNAGHVVVAGPPAEVLTAKLLKDVFRVEGTVEVDSNGECTVRFTRPRRNANLHAKEFLP